MSTTELRSWQPRSYQEQAVRLGVSQACAGFLLRPGMGKTTISYAIVKVLKSKHLIKRVLVVAPLRVIYNVWPKQKNDWAEFASLRVHVLHGKNRVANLRNLDGDIYCINPEGLEWLDTPEHLAWLQQYFDVLIVDESTKFKNTGTQRFKRARKFIQHFKRRYILTGSFTPNGLLDLFGQVYLLDEGAALGRYVTHYKTKYFYPTDRLGYTLAPHAWAADEIARKIQPLTLVLDREGNLDMPELIFNDVLVDLPPAARKQYEQMEQHMLTTLDAELVVAANAAVATSKCRQIANGCLFTNAGEGAWTDMHDAKIDALKDLVEELSGESLLVVYEFKPDLEKLRKAFPNAVLLTGGSATQDANNITLFAGGFVQMGLGQFTSISLGIDGLQNKCRNVVMFGLTWNLQDYSQTIDRIWRQGQKADTVIVHRLIAKDTVDERVLRVLNNKDATQSSFLTLLKGMAKQ
jgi:SNF2 family DNA or RNA helicase